MRKRFVIDDGDDVPKFRVSLKENHDGINVVINDDWYVCVITSEGKLYLYEGIDDAETGLVVDDETGKIVLDE